MRPCEHTVFACARHVASCRGACQPSLTHRIYPFFCCQHAQVKHSLITRSFRIHARFLFGSVSRTPFAPSACTNLRHITQHFRLIRRNVPWNSMFSKANITGMEHVRDSSDATVDPCLISGGVVREIHRNARHSIYVGRGSNGWMWAGAQRSALVLGPPRSGKTSSLVIPNILLSDGPVVSTSTKPDVLRATAVARSRDGWALLYDPSGEVECPKGVERVGWSPLHGASNWDTAVATAGAMVRSSRHGGSRAVEHHWTERAGALLAVLLHAAASQELGVRDLLRWIDRHDGAEALEILSGSGSEDVATDLLTGIVATDPREQSGIWSTASGVLAAYRAESVLASTEAPPLDLRAFADGSNALYICSTGRRQRQF